MFCLQTPETGSFQTSPRRGSQKQSTRLNRLPYLETLSAPPPSYETTVIASANVGEDGEVLIEGLPVGDLGAFAGHFLFSVAFDFVGYVLTAITASSHSARAGSRIGLSFTLCRY